MAPWLLLTPLLAAINLAAFVALRGRWGGAVLVFALAALVGTAAGEWLGRAAGLDLLRLGDYRAGAACIGAQAAMLVSLLLMVLVPSPAERSGE